MSKQKKTERRGSTKSLSKGGKTSSKSNTSQNRQNKTTVIWLIVLFIVVAAAVITGLTLWLTADRQKTESKFTVIYAGAEFTDKGNRIILPNSGIARFTLKNGTENYGVKIVANADFDYEVGGVTVSFAGDDYTSVFMSVSDYGEGYFVIECNDLTMKSVLTELWGGAEVNLPVLKDAYYFKLIVTLGDESVEFVFNVSTIVTGIKLDKEHVVL